jgi:hypothetical protein
VYDRITVVRATAEARRGRRGAGSREQKGKETGDFVLAWLWFVATLLIRCVYRCCVIRFCLLKRKEGGRVVATWLRSGQLNRLGRDHYPLHGIILLHHYLRLV